MSDVLARGNYRDACRVVNGSSLASRVGVASAAHAAAALPGEVDVNTAGKELVGGWGL